MKVINDISYNKAHGFRGLGDLYLPDTVTPQTKAALLIHGGGWSAQDKSSFSGVADWICGELGMAAYNINYRLCVEHPWPAGGDDCLDAGNFLLNAEIPEFQLFDRKRILIVGASAGGHLALMTGMRLPPDRIAGIVSISGISDAVPDYEANPNRYIKLFHRNPTAEDLRILNPGTYLNSACPKILCTHDRNDNIVPMESDRLFAEKAEKSGVNIETFYYEMPETGWSHRLWIPESSPHKLYRNLELRIAEFIKKIF